MRERGFADVFEKANYTQHRSWINALSQSLVVEADVAAGDRDFEFLAGLSDAVNRLRELPHDVGLLGIGEVQAIRRADGSRARAGDVASGFGNRVHRAELRIEIAPSPVAIEGHRESALRAFDSNYAAITDPGSLHRVGLHHGIVLLVNPTLAADVGARKQLLEIVGQINFLAQLHMLRRFASHRRIPALQRTTINRSVIGQRGIRNIGNNFSVLKHAHARLADHTPDFDRVEPPLAEYFDNFLFAAFLRD